MYYTTDYASPVGRIKLAADGEGLVGLWLEGQKYFAGTVKEEMTEDRELCIFKNTKFPVLSHLFFYSTGEILLSFQP